MPTRRKALATLATLPVAVVSANPEKKVKQPRRLVIPEAGIRRIEEIFKEGGEITSITIHYSLPCEPGRTHHGATGLWGDELKGLKIE